MKKYINTDYLFSYWTLAWFFLFIFGIVKTSPKLIFIIELFIVICMLLYFISSNMKRKYIYEFIIINFFMKVIPLYVMWNNEITLNSIASSVTLFITYVFWMFINNKNIYNTYKNIDKGYHSYPGSIFLNILRKLYSKIV